MHSNLLNMGLCSHRPVRVPMFITVPSSSSDAHVPNTVNHMNHFYITWMVECVHVAYLGKRGHQDALPARFCLETWQMPHLDYLKDLLLMYLHAFHGLHTGRYITSLYILESTYVPWSRYRKWHHFPYPRRTIGPMLHHLKEAKKKTPKIFSTFNRNFLMLCVNLSVLVHFFIPSQN